jgi:hypothetical protein
MVTSIVLCSPWVASHVACLIAIRTAERILK